MIGIGIGLLAIGLGDLAAGGISGVPVSPRRSVAGVATATVAALATAILVGLGIRSIEITIFVALSSGAWLWARTGTNADPKVTRWALGIHGAFLMALVGLSQRWNGGDGAVLDFMADLPLPGSGHDAVLVGGILVYLSASANAIVRVVLAMAGTEVERSQQRLRGGRVIGVIERWLIYGLAIAGQPTAAAVIVSAKSILRFPELTKAARIELRNGDTGPAEVDLVTEYFLLGSMVSWLVALVPAVLG